MLATRTQQLGASTSAPSVAAPRFWLNSRGRRTIVCASSGGAREFEAAAKRAFRKAESFAKEQEPVVNDAVRKMGEAADVAKDKAKRLYVQLDSEYDLSGRTERATRRAKEVARDVDQEWGVRRRLRSAREYVVRMWPLWQRQLDDFSQTWYGKAAIIAGLCLVVSTPLFWSFLNLALLLWWLSIPLSYLVLDYARRQQAQRLQQQAEEEAEAARRAARNPFAEAFRSAMGGAGAGSGAGRGRGSSSGGRPRGGSKQADGPIIEAEWTSLDENDAPKRRR